MVARLQTGLDLRTLYGNPEADYLSRLEDDATNEDLYEFYLDRVSVVYASTTQIIDVKVEAFAAVDAQMIAKAIVALCDELVNLIAQKSREDTLRFAGKEIKIAEKRVEMSRVALSGFRIKHGDLDPVSSASAASAIVSGIAGELAKAQTELTALLSYLRNDSTQVVTAKSRVSALKKQLAKERRRLAGPQSKGTFVPLLAEYERLKIEDEFAKQAYTAAGASLEVARAEASRKHLYLVAFVEPSLPDEAMQPERLKMIITVIVCSLLIYGLVSLLTEAIKEHSRE